MILMQFNHRGGNVWDVKRSESFFSLRIQIRARGKGFQMVLRIVQTKKPLRNGVAFC